MQQDKMYLIRDREAGNIIGDNLTEAEAKALVIEFEGIDTKEGTYTKDFYEIVEMQQDKNTTTESLLNGITKGEWTLRKTATGWIVEAIGKPVEMFAAGTYAKADDFIPTIVIYEADVTPEQTANALLIANAPRLAAENKALIDRNKQLEFHLKRMLPIVEDAKLYGEESEWVSEANAALQNNK